MTTPQKSPDHFWVWSKMSQNSPSTTTATDLGILSGPTTPGFFQKQCHAQGISFPHCGRKKKSPNLGYGLARPRIFRDLSKEISAHPPSEFFPIHVSGLEKLYVKSVSHTLELFVHDVELSIQRDENMALNIS